MVACVFANLFFTRPLQIKKPKSFVPPTGKDLKRTSNAPSALRARSQRILPTRIELPRKKVREKNPTEPMLIFSRLPFVLVPTAMALRVCIRWTTPACLCQCNRAKTLANCCAVCHTAFCCRTTTTNCTCWCPTCMCDAPTWEMHPFQQNWCCLNQGTKKVSFGV